MGGRVSVRSRGPSSTSVRRLLTVMFVGAVVAGCAGADEGAAPPSATASPVPSATASTTGPDDGADGSDGPTPSSTDEDPTDDATGSTGGGDDALPGEPFEGFAREGSVLAVVGVAHDDVLNVRAAPGTDRDVVATAAPTDADLVATGRERLLDTSTWTEVEVDGVTGWASSRFLAFIGGTDDATAELLDGGERPRAETMLELGAMVAALEASTDPPSDIVMSVAPTVGDLGEVTYDVIGLGDDSVHGVRLHVFGTSEGGEGFVLRTVERTTLCGRGSDGELCV